MGEVMGEAVGDVIGRGEGRKGVWGSSIWLLLRRSDMSNLTYFRGCWNEKLEFWNLACLVVFGIQNGRRVLRKRVFIYIVVVVVEYKNSKIPRFQ